MLKCYKCGSSHKKFQSPAYVKVCTRCKGKHNFAAMYKTRKNYNYRKVNKIENSEQNEDLYIDSVSQNVVNCQYNMVSISSLDNVSLKKI